MSKKGFNNKEFLEGNLSVHEMLSQNLKQGTDKDFIEAYQKIIKQSHDEQNAGFNPFEKVEAQKTKRITGLKKILSYAAIVVALVGFSAIYYYLNISEKHSPNTIQLAEAQQKTEQALLCFSKELNETMKNFKEIKYEPQPIDKLEKVEFKKIKIEFKNPMKNLNIK